VCRAGKEWSVVLALLVTMEHKDLRGSMVLLAFKGWLER